MSEFSLFTKEEILSAYDVVKATSTYVRTPLLQSVQDMFPLENNLQLYLKLENMQTTGSFKFRGMANLMNGFEETGKIPIALADANWEMEFATYLHNRGMAGKCVIPDFTPENNVKMLQDFGMSTEMVPESEMRSTVEDFVKAGTHVFFDSINSKKLIAGYSSIGVEIIEELPVPDILLICCGSGALASGIASAVKTIGPSDCRVYAVEPESAPSVADSLKEGKAVSHYGSTVATGLAAHYAGELPYHYLKEFVEGSLLVSDVEILSSVELLYKRGLVVEPSGAAAMAALLNGKVPDVEGKKVCVLITGGNISPRELSEYIHSEI